MKYNRRKKQTALFLVTALLMTLLSTSGVNVSADTLQNVEKVSDAAYNVMGTSNDAPEAASDPQSDPEGTGDTSSGQKGTSEDASSETATGEEGSTTEKTSSEEGSTTEKATSEEGSTTEKTSGEQTGTTENEATTQQASTEQVTTEATTEAASTEVLEDQMIRNPELAYTGLSPADSKVLVIDPGHCRIHPGASGNGLKEEVVVLDISMAMYDELADYGDITVYMTRETGDCCKNLGLGKDCLYARSNYAMQLEADFLVSVHINAGYTTGANALVAYNSGYHEHIAKETQAFGKIALKELHKLGIANRGFLLRKSGSGSRYNNGKLADYYAIVRRGVVDQIPAVIMEHGYITSATDCKKFFKTKAQRKKVGTADANAVISYYNLSKKTVPGEFIQENGGTYYKNSAGQKVSGWVKSDGTWFYFDEMTGQMKTGFLTQGENTFYLSPNTGEMIVGEFSVDGSKYMARGNGTLVKAAIHSDGIGTYLYDLVGRKLKKGFHTIDNNTYYVVSDKKVAKGLTKISSKYYGFDSDTGKMLYGSQTIGKKSYYFDPQTGVAAKNKMVVIGDETYYYGSKAYEQGGWVKYKGAKYYFDKSSHEMVTGWKKISGKYYYFDEDTGKMAKSRWIGKYYVNNKGMRTKKK